MKKLGIIATILFLIIVGFSFYVFAVESSQQSHRINNSQTTSYLEHGEAIKVTNNCGKDMFIPANTSDEWSDFNNSAPSCATLDGDFVDCVSAATGNTCTGTELAQGSTGGETWSNCKSWCETQNDGTCCLILSGQDNDCAVYDGIVSGSGTLSGSCTDYD